MVVRCWVCGCGGCRWLILMECCLFVVSFGCVIVWVFFWYCLGGWVCGVFCLIVSV